MLRTVEMAAFPEDPGWIHSIPHGCCNSSYREFDTLFLAPEVLPHTWCPDGHAGKILIQKK